MYYSCFQLKRKSSTKDSAQIFLNGNYFPSCRVAIFFFSTNSFLCILLVLGTLFSSLEIHCFGERSLVEAKVAWKFRRRHTLFLSFSFYIQFFFRCARRWPRKLRARRFFLINFSWVKVFRDFHHPLLKSALNSAGRLCSLLEIVKILKLPSASYAMCKMFYEQHWNELNGRKICVFAWIFSVVFS